MIKTHSRYYNKSQHFMKMRENKLRDKLNMTCIIKKSIFDIHGLSEWDMKLANL